MYCSLLRIQFTSSTQIKPKERIGGGIRSLLSHRIWLLDEL